MDAADLEAVLAADGSLEGGTVTAAQVERAKQLGLRRLAARHRAVEASRALRRDVRRLRECLSLLPSTQRTVLVLRANLGAPAPRSRSTVAEQLGISVARVFRLERAGLSRLRRGCGAGAETGGGTTVAFDGTGGSAFAGMMDQRRPAPSGDGAAPPRERSGAGGVAGVVASASPASVLTRGQATPGQTGGWSFLLLLAALAVLGALGALLILRPGRRPVPPRPAPLVAPAPEPPAAKAPPAWESVAGNGSPTTPVAPPPPTPVPAPMRGGANGEPQPARHRARAVGAGALALVALELVRRRLRR